MCLKITNHSISFMHAPYIHCFTSTKPHMTLYQTPYKLQLTSSSIFGGLFGSSHWVMEEPFTSHSMKGHSNNLDLKFRKNIKVHIAIMLMIYTNYVANTMRLPG